VACALLLLIVGNSMPWLLGRLLGEHLRLPLDFGFTLPDGRALFGAHKTWRGLLGGLFGGALTAELCGLHWQLGLGFAALSLAGDALSSALKRRLAIRPGREVLGLDQLPEALLPLALLRAGLGLDWAQVAATAAIFLVLDIAAAGFRREVVRT